MGCTLDKYMSYDVKEVFKDNGRTLVRLSNPPASCPDGVLSNSRTQVVQNSKVDHITLAFSGQSNAPVVLMPRNTTMVVRTDPLMVPTENGIGFWGWTFILLGVAFLAWLFIKLITPRHPHSEDGSTYIPRSNGPRGGGSPGTTHAGYPAPTQVVHTHNNDGLVTGMVLGNMLADRGGHSETRIIERERVVHDAPASEPSGSFGSDDSDSGSSYSSDDGGSSSSSDFGSDSGGSFGSDGGGGSFGND